MLSYFVSFFRYFVMQNAMIVIYSHDYYVIAINSVFASKMK